jgi:hypothetical protein
MTREDAIQRAAVQLHWGKGGKAQWKNRYGDWEDIEQCHVWSYEFDVRIKPEPKLRPWRPEEVPLGAILKRVKILYNETDIDSLEVGFETVIVSKSPRCGLQCVSGKGVQTILADTEHWCNLPMTHEYSTDGGKTFKPCGVEESA